MEQQFPTHPEPSYSPESRIVGREIRVGPSEKDDLGNWIKGGVFIEINGQRATFSGGNIRTLASCIEKWADFAEGKISESPHPKIFMGDIFAPICKSKIAP